ncbi:hypothetical protein MOQ72_02645 [Saccharopolyspora sp. K220]|uniref:hypothetical protein n=1 Tax=Saccharopolyspora soli TaxID=2926618 RepID=UPI001F5820BE|nr:hypothetical protein [Saccharopolyspora soli]MCI2416309.1 hypothetical protein [Saccharopolyspora soli]
MDESIDYSGWLADLARKVRAIEEEVKRCQYGASVRLGCSVSPVATLVARSHLCDAAVELDKMSKEWADEGI